MGRPVGWPNFLKRFMHLCLIRLDVRSLFATFSLHAFRASSSHVGSLVSMPSFKQMVRVPLSTPIPNRRTASPPRNRRLRSSKIFARAVGVLDFFEFWSIQPLAFGNCRCDYV
jgi:hypothetical protein